MFLELERSTYSGIRAYLLKLFTLEYNDTHADFTHWYQCANQKRIGYWNKRFFCFTLYRYE